MKKQIFTVLTAAGLLAGCANLCEVNGPCSANKADFTLDPTLFAFDSAVLTPKAEESLNKVAVALKRSNNKVQINGYTDITGNAAYNVQLSKDRAKSVADYLAHRGIEKERLTINGFGATNFATTNATKAGRAQNRRVNIVVE